MRFERRILKEGDPDAVWDPERELWLESDDSLRRRIKVCTTLHPMDWECGKCDAPESED